jgi:hypothetical protein
LSAQNYLFCAPLKYWYASFTFYAHSHSHVVQFQSPMPAVRADDSGPECGGSSCIPNKRRSSLRKAAQPYPTPNSDIDDPVSHTRQSQSQTEESIISLEGTIVSSDPVQFTSEHSPQSMFVGPITISGVILRPTVAFDTFWRFAAERKALDDKRRAGEPAP